MEKNRVSFTISVNYTHITPKIICDTSGMKTNITELSKIIDKESQKPLKGFISYRIEFIEIKRPDKKVDCRFAYNSEKSMASEEYEHIRSLEPKSYDDPSISPAVAVQDDEPYFFFEQDKAKVACPFKIKIQCTLIL